ncbi:flagellar basal body rod protein FlgB [Aureliella helgolandensis]|uniref:Flagellar basal body rod protein FlgB n=1 Tax=Aureliella helgolandensis TaxID=2527968 RepID=A0A518GGB5_9BACT|nr:flagellar basal body rod protein FlgB [Aureliella helgolandensis]QDV27623.1 Flagellar basal body rod protein FlgB [Aureliella helgolandensis]
MWDSWLSNSTLPALEQSATFAQKRHMLLAGNIANLDTPGYQTRDISIEDFHASLREAIESKHAPEVYRSPGSNAVLPDQMEKVRDVTKQILYHDGSDVSVEEQVTEISKNQAMHNMSIALMRSQLRTLQAAIRESASV